MLKQFILMSMPVGACSAQEGEVRIAIAANFYKPMLQLAKEF